ncbi:MAG: hypothetical protein V8R02_11680 [Clostridium sp.]
MKKLYNKALFYQYLYNGKWIILFGIIIFYISVYGETQNLFTALKSNISSIYTNKMDSRSILYLFIMCVILFGIYIFTTGFNKRNNLTFLNASPFTRKEIKKNEILFLLYSLSIFVFIFIYMNLCLYYNQRELLSISYNYIYVLISDTLRLIFIGCLFIVYLEFMDMIFSNTIFTIIAMIIFPLAFICNFLCIVSILENIELFSFSGIINSVLSKIENIIISYLLLGRYDITKIESIITYLFLLLIIVVGFILIDKINKKFTINNLNKFFSFAIVKKIFIWVTSLSVVNLIISMLFNKYMYEIYNEKFYNENPYYIGQTPLPFNLLEKILIFIIISIIVILITKFLVKKINKFVERIM